jgi:hypothetical protein
VAGRHILGHGGGVATPMGRLGVAEAILKGRIKKQKKLKSFVWPIPKAVGVASHIRPLAATPGQTVALGGGPATPKGQIKQKQKLYFLLFYFKFIFKNKLLFYYYF